MPAVFSPLHDELLDHAGGYCGRPHSRWLHARFCHDSTFDAVALFHPLPTDADRPQGLQNSSYGQRVYCSALFSRQREPEFEYPPMNVASPSPKSVLVSLSKGNSLRICWKPAKVFCRTARKVPSRYFLELDVVVNSIGTSVGWRQGNGWQLSGHALFSPLRSSVKPGAGELR
jgi:hypothetical protein